MDESAALKLVLPPDTYRCTWNIPDSKGGVQELGGDIHLRADKSPRGETYGEFPEVWEKVENGISSAGFPQQRSYPVLTCNLANGRAVTLFDARVSVLTPDRAIVLARSALAGSPSPEGGGMRFNRIKIQIENIDSLFGVAPTKPRSLPVVGGVVDFDGKWGVEREPESIQWWEDGDASLCMAYDSSEKAVDPYYFRIGFSPVVIVDLHDEISFDDLLKQWLNPLQKIVSLALGKRREITYFAVGTREAEMRSKGWGSRYEVYGKGIQQEPFESNLKNVTQNQSVMNWKTDSKNPLEVLRLWSALREQHNPLIETYGTLLTAQSQHPRAKLLLLLQALEGLHGFESKEKEVEAQVKHKSRRSAILDEILSATSLSGEDKRFLKRNFTTRPLVSLDTRLRESFSSIPEGVMAKLSSSALVASFANDPREPKDKDPADVLRLTRNDLSHGNRGYPMRDLEEVADILERATRAHLLRCLGSSVGAQVRVIKGGNY
ncbi:hypothetical protein OG728_27005 [Streptomyces microflavus]|uniref:ApeA N-terminal domain 1-containing protein n=1 Tax=Streptomyces microflavus TaxID=1919 RepID=UPI002E0F939E|nr:hypothetical protein OG728_27005 [Streptomyces microflavus]